MHKAPTLSILSGFHAFLIQQYKYRLVVGGTLFFLFFFLSGEEEGGVSMNAFTCFTVEFTGTIFFFLNTILLLHTLCKDSTLLLNCATHFQKLQ